MIKRICNIRNNHPYYPLPQLYRSSNCPIIQEQYDKENKIKKYIKFIRTDIRVINKIINYEKDRRIALYQVLNNKNDKLLGFIFKNIMNYIDIYTNNKDIYKYIDELIDEDKILYKDRNKIFGLKLFVNICPYINIEERQNILNNIKILNNTPKNFMLSNVLKNEIFEKIKKIKNKCCENEYYIYNILINLKKYDLN